MNDGMLSQDEIDALLKVSDDDAGPMKSNDTKADLKEIEIDTIGEIGNIAFSSSATTLSMLLNHKVEITTPSVSFIAKEDLDKEFTFQPVSIQVDYTNGFSGRNVFVIKAADAAVIADIMLGGDGTDPEPALTDISLSAVQEAMNQMMGTAATSMSTIFNKKVDITPPVIIEGPIEDEAQELFEEDKYVKVFFRLIVGNLIDSNMMQLMPLSFAKELIDQLLHAEVTDDEKQSSYEAGSTDEKASSSAENTASYKDKADTAKLSDQDSSGHQERKQAAHREARYLGDNFDKNHTTVEKAAFSSFESPSLSDKEKRNLDMLLDISLNVTVELGKAKRSIRDILELTSGSIVELDKLAGEPVDILVNGKLIAEGEVIVIEENFGVRVTDIISQSDRLMKLK